MTVRYPTTESSSELATPGGYGDSSARPARNQAIDAIRAFAVAGIVFVHVTESSAFFQINNLFRFGVPFFLFASMYFQSVSMLRRPDRSLSQLIWSRITRLYIPFLVWSLIYLLIRDCERAKLRHLSAVAPSLNMLWTARNITCGSCRFC